MEKSLGGDQTKAKLQQKRTKVCLKSTKNYEKIHIIKNATFQSTFKIDLPLKLIL